MLGSIVAGVFASASLGDYFTGLALVGAATATLAIGRVKNKDNTIHMLEDECAATKGLLDAREKQLEGAQKRADNEHLKRSEAQERCARLEGQLEELRPYGEAFKELTSRLERTESVVGTAIMEQGELIMKNTEVSAQSVKALEHVSKDLGAIGKDLGSLVADFKTMAEHFGAGGDRPIDSV